MPRTSKKKIQNELIKDEFEVDVEHKNDDMDKPDMKSISNDEQHLQGEVKGDDVDKISSEIKDIIGEISNAIKEQNKIIINQQKKIEEQDKKINDIIGVITAFLQGGIDIPGQQMQGQDQDISDNQGQQNEMENQGAFGVSQNRAVVANKQGTFNMDRLTEVLRSIAIITSSMNPPRNEGSDVVGSIQQAIGIASSIAGAFGEGLARIFEAFNQMEERAFKSYATRFKSMKMDDDVEKTVEKTVEKAVEKVIEKKLKLKGEE